MTKTPHTRFRPTLAGKSTPSGINQAKKAFRKIAPLFAIFSLTAIAIALYTRFVLHSIQQQQHHDTSAPISAPTTSAVVPSAAPTLSFSLRNNFIAIPPLVIPPAAILPLHSPSRAPRYLDHLPKPDNYPHHFICRGGSVAGRYSCGTLE
jgi:hypothetical protein